MYHYYCTIVSSDYIYKVLALYKSMAKHDKAFNFFIICMNEEVMKLFTDLMLEGVELVLIQEIEAAYPVLKGIKKTRNDKEYAWTVKPSALLYIFDKYTDIDHILWLDGDTMFLSDPSPIYVEWGAYSILLTEERYTGKHAFMSRIYGIYNTGLLGFKRNKEAIDCLKWLQVKVNEWCYDRIENGLWSDQMHFNDLPQRFEGIKVIKNPGVNMTPFILWRFTENEKNQVVTKKGGIYVKNKRLILFHYYGFRYYSRKEYELCSYKDWGLSKQVIESIYMPYIAACDAAIQQLKGMNSDENGTSIESESGIELSIKTEEGADKYYPDCCFCTLTTLEYLPKFLALFASIERHTESFHMWVCCMDAMTYDILTKMQLGNATVLEHTEIEDDSLRSVKNGRKQYEYCWTLKAPLILHIFDNYSSVNSLLYVDSDIFLFSKPTRCFELLKKYPILLTCHNFSKSFKYLYKKKGRFNAGIIGFRRCSIAIRSLNWWKRKCIEWCYDLISEGRFADQKYLEEFGKLFGGAYTADSVGMNAALWNAGDVSVHAIHENMLIGGSLLIFYHFSSFLVLNEHEFDLWKWNRLDISELKKKLIYIPYAEAVAKSIRNIKPYIADISKVYSEVDALYQASNFVSIENVE